MIAVVVDTCNGFTEILDAFAKAASSARICVYNEDILCSDEKHNKHAEELRKNLRNSFRQISRVSQAEFKARKMEELIEA